ncbi:MAG TPA: hypothetical protein VGD76_13530 [Ramlibacter sp.]
MSTRSSADDQDDGLPPAGSRWGAGARSVLPYLTKSLQSKPASAPDSREAKAHDAQQPAEDRPRASAA